jgi:hypothetical protein
MIAPVNSVKTLITCSVNPTTDKRYRNGKPLGNGAKGLTFTEGSNHGAT